MDKKQRTNKQNDSLHLYFRQLAEDLNDSGLDQRTVLKPSVEIPWTEQAVKKQLWAPIQKAMIGEQSTTELNTKQVSEVYEVLNRHISTKWGVHTPFPSNEQEMEAKKIFNIN